MQFTDAPPPSPKCPDRDTPTVVSHAEMKRRRAAALEMRLEGRTQVYIAKRLNVSQPTVSHWLRGVPRPRAAKAPDHPPAACPKPREGRAQFLTDEQLRELLKCLGNRSLTARDFQQAVRDAFGVDYSLSHCCALLKYLRGDAPTRFGAARASDAKPLVRRAGA